MLVKKKNVGQRSEIARGVADNEIMSILVPLTLAASLAQGQSAPVDVLILGTYHMANPKLDLVQTDIRDTMGADRQREIAEVNAMLAKFKPTKIVVEAVPPAESLKSAYEKFLAGNHELTADERQQIGFRLAKQLGHKELYAVDHQIGMDFDKLMASAQKQGKVQFLQRVQEVIGKVSKAIGELDKNHTAGEILAAMNTPKGLWQNHSFYMEMLEVDNGQEFAGADLVADWYKRNLYIFSNIKRLAKPGDRILVIYGSGHAKLLSDMVRDTRGFRLEDPLKYLPKPAPFDLDFGL